MDLGREKPNLEEADGEEGNRDSSSTADRAPSPSDSVELPIKSPRSPGAASDAEGSSVSSAGKVGKRSLL